MDNVFSSIALAVPSSARIAPAKYLKCSDASGISTFLVSLIGLPLSRVSTMARWSAFSSIISAILFKIFALSYLFVFLNWWKPSQAALTALSTSASDAWAIDASFSPSAGQNTSKVSPFSLSTNSPPINRPYFLSKLMFGLVILHSLLYFNVSYKAFV